MDKQVWFIDSEAYTTMQFLIASLRTKGYTVDSSQTIEDTLNKLEEYSETGRKPDLVFLEPIMPVRDKDLNALKLYEKRHGKINEKFSNFINNVQTSGLVTIPAIRVVLPETEIYGYTLHGRETEIGYRIANFLEGEKIPVIEKPLTLDVFEDIIRGNIGLEV